MSKQIHGFGVPVGNNVHHWIVRIQGRGKNKTIELFEDLGGGHGKNEEPIQYRCGCHHQIWDLIKVGVRNDFNNTLIKHGLPKCEWKTGDNPVDRLLGKELYLLITATGHYYHRTRKVLKAWSCLRREERWWLARKCLEKDEGAGWRMAMVFALGYCEGDYHSYRSPKE